MTKWADYGISEVRYNATHTHIDRVRIRKDKDTTFGETEEHQRTAIVKAIKEGVTFVTIMWVDGKWQKGQPVHIIRVNGTEYIKSRDNGREGDNLENLPEF
ncbi:hypothetical protein CSC74_09605 [Pseudoxanthomonas yeongjuensis]|uniref:DUF3892 domain-containing protein n=1 Tax=Pseudoxanthomonas yeongjuensis TaxID=377616 RepID=UPI0013910226|nr:DUF3892 domain-containing protein [Pseudoxanthomonas yeongjuensis]KAF1717097.1 hypothetical protein CSC74_09605 [Pseudoxanthomonas yeongjuensis]